MNNTITDSSICLPFRSSMKITSLYGMRKLSWENYVERLHAGMDIVGISDTTVVSICYGVVKKVQSASDGSGFGNRVWVVNEQTGISIVYAHLAYASCKRGQIIHPKDVIGKMGNTGNSSGPHLHIGIYKNTTCSAKDGDSTDPAYWFCMNSPKAGEVYDGTGYVSATSKKYSNLEDLNNGKYVEEQSDAVISSLEISEEYYKLVEGTTQYSDSLYGRRYRIVVVSEDGTAVDVSALRCSFELIKSWTNYEETSTLTIYNLNAEHENQIIKSGKTVFVEAGYAGKSSYGLIYKGTIIQAIRSKDLGTDYMLQLIMGDSSVFNTYSVLGVTVNSENNMRRVISEVVNKSGNLTGDNYGISEGDITNFSDQIKLPRGKILFGKSSTILNQIANTLNSTCYIENGVVNFVSLESENQDVILDIGPDSGMIGVPSQIQNGISVTCLLNPNFKLNTLFHIDNSSVQTLRYTLGQAYIPLDTQGIYRVIKITHKGDTRGNDWFTEVEALSQVGSLPNISSNGYTAAF